MQLTGADILIRTLIEQGCDTVFGYPGGQILTFTTVFINIRMKFATC